MQLNVAHSRTSGKRQTWSLVWKTWYSVRAQLEVKWWCDAKVRVQTVSEDKEIINT